MTVQSYSCRLILVMCIIIALPLSAGSLDADDRDETMDIYAKDNLVAWCIVPFDAAKRGPEQRAQMLKRLGVKKVAYDWRDEHVASFEEEIVAYQRHGLEYFAFWSWHPDMAALIKKYEIKPQIWVTVPSPAGSTQEEKVEAAGKALLTVAKQAHKLDCKLGLYNHGGWGGEPTNMVAVCKWLRENTGSDHVGVVYNFHHGHDHIDGFAELLGLMKPYLLCLNLNGMNDAAQPKILPIGQGQHEKRMMRIVRDGGYTGPIGILDHRPELDAELSLGQNLEGLEKLRGELEASPVPGKQVEQRLELDDRSDISYLQYLPEGYDAGDDKWPLMLFLHGRGESNGPLSLVTKWGPPRMLSLGDKLPYIVVSPQCPRDDRWTSDQQQELLTKLLDHIQSNYRVDADRVYLTGLSMGGYGSWRLAADHPERFAAVAPVCGGGKPADAARLTSLPIWVFHGDQDGAVPFSRSVEMVEAIRAAGGTKIRFTTLEHVGHNSWSAAYATPELYDWFDKQRASANQ